MISQRKEAGYSLIEALIAVALLAGLSASLAPAVQASLKTSARIGLAAVRAEEERVAVAALADIFSGAVNYGSQAERETDAAGFKGAPAEITLTTLGDLNGAPQHIRLSIRNNRLALQITPLDHESLAPIEAVLAENVSRFEYFGAEDHAHAAPSWRSRWNEPAPPRLIRLHRTPKSRDGRAVPPLEFAIVTRAPLHCQFDQVSRRCRN